jgi:hypothetical protein
MKLYDALRWSVTVIIPFVSATPIHSLPYPEQYMGWTYTDPLVFRQSMQSAPSAWTFVGKLDLGRTTDSDGEVLGEGELDFSAEA